VAEGLNKAKTEAARKMKTKGLPVCDICEYTGLSAVEIGNL